MTFSVLFSLNKTSVLIKGRHTWRWQLDSTLPYMITFFFCKKEKKKEVVILGTALCTLHNLYRSLHTRCIVNACVIRITKKQSYPFSVVICFPESSSNNETPFHKYCKMAYGFSQVMLRKVFLHSTLSIHGSKPDVLIRSHFWQEIVRAQS